MTIEIAKPEHLNNIMQVIDAARNSMRANGNLSQWINGYPSADVILKHSIVNGLILPNFADDVFLSLNAIKVSKNH